MTKQKQKPTPEIVDTDNIIEIVQLTKVYKTAGSSVVALSDVDLAIKKGEIFGIIGLSGAGKSTLVRCINLLEKPTHGDVLFCGKNLMSISRKELLQARRQIGMIFQQFNLFAQRTVLRNVTYPLEIAGVKKEQAIARAKELLDMVGLKDKCNAYPSQLSGGQKQRVAIARALASDPQVLLCDEATSALDNATTNSILQLIKRINTELGVTVVIITHEMKVVESVCDRVAVIDQSRIAECGTVKDVFLNPRSDIAKQLILPKTTDATVADDDRCVRLIFDGNTFNQPIVSALAIECNALVNILFADTKTIEGKTYGQMVIQLPKDINARRKIEDYLTARQVTYKEEELPQ